MADALNFIVSLHSDIVFIPNLQLKIVDSTTTIIVISRYEGPKKERHQVDTNIGHGIVLHLYRESLQDTKRQKVSWNGSTVVRSYFRTREKRELTESHHVRCG
jgi:hypothetical protein